MNKKYLKSSRRKSPSKSPPKFSPTRLIKNLFLNQNTLQKAIIITPLLISLLTWIKSMIDSIQLQHYKNKFQDHLEEFIDDPSSIKFQQLINFVYEILPDEIDKNIKLVNYIDDKLSRAFISDLLPKGHVRDVGTNRILNKLLLLPKFQKEYRTVNPYSIQSEAKHG